MDHHVCVYGCYVLRYEYDGAGSDKGHGHDMRPRLNTRNKKWKMQSWSCVQMNSWILTADLLTHYTHVAPVKTEIIWDITNNIVNLRPGDTISVSRCTHGQTMTIESFEHWVHLSMEQYRLSLAYNSPTFTLCFAISKCKIQVMIVQRASIHYLRMAVHYPIIYLEL